MCKYFQRQTWASWNLGGGEAEKRGGEEKARNILKQSANICLHQMRNWLWQVDKGAAETGVEGVAGRPLRPRLPALHPARRPPCLHEGGLEGVGRELADHPWSVNREKVLLERRRRGARHNFNNCQIFLQSSSGCFVGCWVKHICSGHFLIQDNMISVFCISFVKIQIEKLLICLWQPFRCF